MFTPFNAKPINRGMGIFVQSCSFLFLIGGCGFIYLGEEITNRVWPAFSKSVQIHYLPEFLA
jgi:hypothetical protein